MTDSSRWAQVERLFLQAVELPLLARDSFLERACDDAELRNEVEAMLRAHDREAGPAIEERLLREPRAEPNEGTPLRLGDTLGHYRLIELLGKGGMGEVYRAHDSRLERDVALKLLPEEVAKNPDRLARFEREAKALAAIRHPGVVTIFDVEHSEGRHFLTMELVLGTTLAEHIPDSGMALQRFWSIGLQLADTLGSAHDLGIVHRDLKPSNIMLGEQDEVTLVDFGLVKRAIHLDEDAETLEARARTRTGMVMGTWKYMSPEQARGEEVDARSDVFSLGIVLYEMLCGGGPFERSSEAEVVASILHERQVPLQEVRPEIPAALASLVDRCLEKDAARRYESGGAVKAALEQLMASLGVGADGVSSPRRSRLLAATAVLALGAAAAFVWFATSGDSSRERWARTEAIPEVLRLIGENRTREAAELALEAEQVLGEDPILEPLWQQMTTSFKISSEPSGAVVSYRPYASSSDAWRQLGVTPWQSDRFPVGAYRVRIEKEGFDSVEVARSLISMMQLIELRNAEFDYLADPSYIVDVELAATGQRAENEIAVKGGLYGTVPLHGFGPVSPVPIPDFVIDRTEVTNAAFHEFVVAGGYEDRVYWQESFAHDNEALDWEQAMTRFRDQTGRPGPSTWSLGQPPEGRDDYPVGGVSWFEAAAYCRWRGASLPTLFHWARAALPSTDVWRAFNPLLVGASNMASEGPVPVASSDAIGISGAHDLAGNVREWVSTASNRGRHLLGGAWEDPTYVVHDRHAASPFRRDEGDGFRCATYPEGDAPEPLRRPMPLPEQNFSIDPHMPDEVFETTQRFYRYDKGLPLAETVESTIEREWGAVEQWVTVDTAYGDRLPIRLHLPKEGTPPFQPIVFFGGGNYLRSSAIEEVQPPMTSLVRAGRALVEPIYDGVFQRNDGRTLQRWIGEGQRQLVAHWIQDLGRTLDYLEQREDIDGERASFLGISLGAQMVPNLIASEPRFGATILYSGGFAIGESQGSIESRAGLLRRIRSPVLMLGGLHDFAIPPELQREMLRFFGTPEVDRHQRLYDSGHWPLPMNEVLRETVDFLDRYLGPVN